MPHTVRHLLLHPSRLWSRHEVLQRPSPVPQEPGVYGWYFRDIPDGVPTDGCHRHAGMTLLYVGISPRRPPVNGAPPSRQQLRKRIRYHFRGNAEGSTLRLTLGCLLSTRLGIELRRVGGGTRHTFASGEALLSDWMQDNAFVCWAPHPDPRTCEEELIRQLVLPLNLEGNSHAFRPKLSALRSAARGRAGQLPIA
ncbi:MAG: hypothetical protein O2973_12365 [Gemmatimonadetes bacterium]|nr:hypothetical protein [Gemmatimonadota bacterium]